MRGVVKVRIAGAAVVLALAAGALSACDSNVGTAAEVDGHRISENSVGGYVTPNGPSPQLLAQAAKQGTTIAPRRIVVQFLVLDQVFRRTLALSADGVPTASQLADVHDDAIRLLGQSSTVGAAFDRNIDTQLTQLGIKTSLRRTYVQVQELEYLLIQRGRLQNPTELAAAVKTANVRVSLNARYGRWDAAQLSVNGAGAVPGYLTLPSMAASAG